ncbi:RWD domain-containing protein 2A [Hylaeus anthracinus]|uniref:RWD domain-containing protein 2A n=1 Tax=Hylaeus volcanicus TaxID=313075 RepID=UPI0023B7EEAD|nr:RWD domain-containing protein 2A [Hylaeus volcanicus]XP_054016077.1 RWD domain-containing protein 2A [Hylaeus anthracinus]
MFTNEEIRQNLSKQVCELEVLESVYPKELTIADHGTLADINDFIQNPKQDLPQRLEYSIELPINGGTIELLVSLSASYPKEKPEVYARSSLLHRTQQLCLNQTLGDVLERQEDNEPCIYALISWLQDHADDYVAVSDGNQGKDDKSEDRGHKQTGPVTFARYWIYSHHIYSKFKRKDIASLAKENSITGFCLAGKPGVICLEGILEDCDYCWQKIKSMNWHRILIRLLEKEENCKDDVQKFQDFQEISFATSERHNDMGQLLKYLTEHKSQHVFKELFGIDGKTSELPE